MHSAGVKIKNRPTPSPRQLSSPAPPPIGGGGETDDEDGSGLPPLVTFETLSREVEGLRRERIDSIYQVLTELKSGVPKKLKSVNPAIELK